MKSVCRRCTVHMHVVFILRFRFRSIAACFGPEMGRVDPWMRNLGLDWMVFSPFLGNVCVFRVLFCAPAMQSVGFRLHGGSGLGGADRQSRFLAIFVKYGLRTRPVHSTYEFETSGLKGTIIGLTRADLHMPDFVSPLDVSLACECREVGGLDVVNQPQV
jgi:hypothetical protein